MAKLNIGTGTTPSEKYLAELSEKTFLKLWSYPNLYIDKKINGIGKELCDLLVVCGDDVIIFSDKSIGWPAGELSLAWPRWYRRAIAKSVDQITGAERWLQNFPDRIFLDPACTEKFPITLPEARTRRIQGVVVAIGAHDACARHFPGSTGTLLVLPVMKDIDSAAPFTVGDVNPHGSFVHVFDNKALDIVMGELNTITDFRDYLEARRNVIRDETLLIAPGEEDLLGYYLQSQDKIGRHGFFAPNGKSLPKGHKFAVTEHTYYRGLLLRDEYYAKKQADEVSYIWDRLIDRFATNLLEGTAITPTGDHVEVRHGEIGLRSMALETRLYRRMLSSVLTEALQRAEQIGLERYARVVLPDSRSAERNLAYVFLILAYPKDVPSIDTYEKYRTARVNILHAYCLTILHQNRELKKVVGLGFDASPNITGRAGGSEDLLVLEVPTWTEELEKQAVDLSEKFEILDPKRVQIGAFEGSEYPQPQGASDSGSASTRQQRRAEERRRRKLFR